MGTAGRALWRKLARDFEFQPWELVPLESLCRTVDRLAAVERELVDAPLMVTSKMGSRANPLLGVEVNLRATLLRHIKALGLAGALETEATPYDSRRRQAAAVLGHARTRRGA